MSFRLETIRPRSHPPLAMAFYPPGILLVSEALPMNPILSMILMVAMVTFPGYAILSLMTLNKGNFLRVLYFSVLFSILFLSIFFAAYSFLAFHFGFHQPLERRPIVSILSILFFLFAIPIIRNEKSVLTISTVKVKSDSNFQKKYLIIPFLVTVPVISFVIVSFLNRGGSSVPAEIFLTSVVLLMISLLSMRTSFHSSSIFIVFFYVLIVAVLLSSSFRGDGGFWGSDINQEYSTASKTFLDGFWIPGSHETVYHSMLSITVLPVVISIITKLSLSSVFKIFYPLLAAFLPIASYSLIRKYARHSVSLGVVLIQIVGSISFISQIVALTRQIVGLAFFLGILMLVLDPIESRSKRVSLILFFTLGLSVSHYSSSYLASILFFFTSVFVSAKEIRNKFKSKSDAEIERTRQKPTLTFFVGVGITIIVLLWNGLINQNLQTTSYVARDLQNQGTAFLPNNHEPFLQRWFYGVNVPTSISNLSYKIATIDSIHLKYPLYSTHQSSYSEELVPATFPKGDPQLPSGWSSALSFGYRASVSAFQLFALSASLLYFFGFIFNLFRKNQKKRGPPFLQISELSIEFSAMLFLALFFGAFSRLSKTLSIVYGPERVAFQLAFIYSIAIALLLEKIYSRNFYRLKDVWLFLPFACFCVLQQTSGLNGFYIGQQSARISNSITADECFVISYEEQQTSKWLFKVLSDSSILQEDGHSALVNYQSVNADKIHQILQFSPYGILNNSYVYLSKSNIRSNIAEFTNPKGTGYVQFQLPLQFLDKNLNLIYSSGGTRVYR